MILLYRGEREECYIRITKMATCKNYSFHHIITPTTNQRKTTTRYKRIVVQTHI
nr:MAG TPA: hypothetical protein [Caudoviricetes sp.]